MVASLIDKLRKQNKLSLNEWIEILTNYTYEDKTYAENIAREITISNFGKEIYFRGIIEYTNYCKNDCYYCGIRRSNSCISRYRLSEQDIFECAKDGYSYGFRTFVLQGGEDPYFTDEILCNIIGNLKKEFSDCAVTLSLGERSYQSYKKLFDAGADRYLLRHEAASENLYCKIHPKYQKLENRLECLNNLKEIGYQTGCGFMIGVPFQTVSNIAEDMQFMQSFKPQMVGLGPFIPHNDTPFGKFESGNVDLTLFIISLTRIMLPNVLMPSTTALGTADGKGRQKGILSGCNVVMPNLSPADVRKKYMLYNNKIGTEFNAETGIRILSEQMSEIGYRIVCSKGDYKE